MSEQEKELQTMLRLRKELDPDAPDAIVLPESSTNVPESLAPETPKS